MAQLFDIGIYSALGVNSALGAAYTLGFYVAGTTTLVDTYSDPDLTTENTNPVVADANGRFPQIWLAPGDYKYVLSNAAAVPLVTVDDYNVPDAPPSFASALDNFLAGTSPLPIANGGTNATSAATGIANLGGLPAAGGTVTGNITRSSKGVHMYWNPAGCTSGEVFITASAASDPTSAAGQWWLKY